MNRNRKTLMIGSILLFLMVLTACRSREQAEMLQKFQQIQQAYWEELERRDYQFVGDARYEEELERYGGAGASISYSLYQSREHPKYAFLQWETNDGSERAYYWMLTENARSWRKEGWSDNMQVFTGRDSFQQIGSFVIKLEPRETEIPRGQADPAVLEQIRSILEAYCADTSAIAYVNTSELYAIVISGDDSWEPYTNGIANLFTYRQIERYDFYGDLGDSCLRLQDRENLQFQSWLSVDGWLYDLARAEAVLKIF